MMRKMTRWGRRIHAIIVWDELSFTFIIAMAAIYAALSMASNALPALILTGWWMVRSVMILAMARSHGWTWEEKHDN